MTHIHLTTIVLTIILFIFTLMYKKKGQNIKVLHLLLRIMYVLIMVTGGMLFFSLYQITFLYVVKAVLGVVMIGLFEMILSVNSKGKKQVGFWIMFIIVLAVLIYLGFKLPLGIYLF